MFNVPVKGTHAHAYVTSFSGQDDLKDAKIKHRTNDSIIETEFYSKCLEWRKKVAAHLKLIETEANDGELAAFASYAIAFPEGFLALVRLNVYNFKIIDYDDISICMTFLVIHIFFYFYFRLTRTMLTGTRL